MSYYLVCKKKVNGSKCSETFAAETKEDVIAAAVKHAESAHGIPQTRGLIDEYKCATKKGTPRA